MQLKKLIKKLFDDLRFLFDSLIILKTDKFNVNLENSTKDLFPHLVFPSEIMLVKPNDVYTNNSLSKTLELIAVYDEDFLFLNRLNSNHIDLNTQKTFVLYTKKKKFLINEISFNN